MIIIEEQTLLTLGTEDLYRIFIAKKRDLLEEQIITQKDVNCVKNGIKIKFSFSKYFRYQDSHDWGVFRQKPKANLIKADESGYVKMDDFYEEVEERAGIMLNALLDYYNTDEDTIERDTNLGRL